MKKWYLGAQNDGLFIVDRQPSQSNDHPVHDASVSLVLPVPAGAKDFAEVVIAAHNTAVQQSGAA